MVSRKQRGHGLESSRKEVKKASRKKREPKKINWTFSVEDLNHYQHASARCVCDSCKRIREFYHIDEGFRQWEIELEDKLAKWKLPKPSTKSSVSSTSETK